MSSQFGRIMQIVVVLSSSMLFSGDAVGQYDCAQRDVELIDCPAPEAPLATELGEGYALLEFTVRTDGSDVDIQVVEQRGDPRWVDAAIGALKRYRYKESSKPRRKTMPFTFVFE